jgi:hypothetical protein
MMAEEALLFEETQFVSRAEAMDWMQLPAHQARRLAAVDDLLFRKLRERVRCGDCRGEAFRAMVREYVCREADDVGWDPLETGYDHLDLFIGHLLPGGVMPTPTVTLDPEMVEYYKTPARVVFEMVERYRIGREDVFIDLGSGLGQVVILVNLLTGARARGVEIEPAYCEYARDSALGLGLADVEFVKADAREAALGDGTVFFLYTPFKGGMMRVVLDRLLQEARLRPIRIIPYGPCSQEVMERCHPTF